MFFLKLREIKARLEEEGIKVSKTSLCLLIKKYKTTGTIADKIRSPAKTKKLKLEHLCLIDKALDEDELMRYVLNYEMLGLWRH